MLTALSRPVVGIAKAQVISSGGAATDYPIAASAISGHRALAILPNGRVVHADPMTVDGYNFAGFSTAASAPGDPVILLAVGKSLKEPGWNWIPGRAVFVGPNGVPTQTPDGVAVLHQIGQALSATVLLLQPYPPTIRK